MKSLREKIEFSDKIGVSYIHKGIKYILSVEYYSPSSPAWGYPLNGYRLNVREIGAAPTTETRVVANGCTAELPETVEISDGTEVVDLELVNHFLIQNVKQVILPSTVKWIAPRCFSCWTRLEKVSTLVNCLISPLAFEVTKIKEVRTEGCSFAQAAFKKSNIEMAIIKNTTFYDEGFAECANLHTVIIDTYRTASFQEKVGAANDIPMGMFKNCTNLAEVCISPKPQTLQPNAFEGCSSLTHLDLSECLSVEERALAGCNLKDIDLRKCQLLGFRSLAYCLITKLNLSSCRFIGSEAFCWCVDLKFLNIVNVTTIQEGAFSHCPSLEYLVCPKEYTDINVLKELTNLQVVFITNGTSRGTLTAMDKAFPKATKFVVDRNTPLTPWIKNITKRNSRVVEVVDNLPLCIEKIYRGIN